MTDASPVLQHCASVAWHEAAMKVLVTGATGFIGAHTVTRLLQGGHEVAALTRTSAPALERAGMKAVRGDVADPADVLGAMAGCEALIHLANVYSFWERDPRIYWRINVEATRGVLDPAVEARLSKVIHVSTYAVFAASPNFGNLLNVTLRAH
jgi:dihydroflavonol-4-reductase